MFTRFVQYRIAVRFTQSDGVAAVFPMSRFSPHLGRDARRIILSADRWILGETAAFLLADGISDLGRLGCRLEPTARTFDVLLERRWLDQQPLSDVRALVICDESNH